MKDRKDYLVELAAAALIQGDRTAVDCVRAAITVLKEIDVSEPAQEAPAPCSGCGRPRSHSDEPCNHCIVSAPAPSALDAELFEALDAGDDKRWWIDEDMMDTDEAKRIARALLAWYEREVERRKNTNEPSKVVGYAAGVAVNMPTQTAAIPVSPDPIRAKLVAKRDAAFRRVSWWKDGDYTQVQSLHVDSIRGGETHPDVRVAAAYRAELALREYDERKANSVDPDPVTLQPMSAREALEKVRYMVERDHDDREEDRRALAILTALVEAHEAYLRKDAKFATRPQIGTNTVGKIDAIRAYMRDEFDACSAADEKLAALERGEQEAR